MKLAVSNIAWTPEEEPSVAALLQELGVQYVEIAPTKRWDDPTMAPDDEVAEYQKFWRSYGIEIVAFQSMLFNRPDLKLFESDENRAVTQQHLSKFISLAGKFGARVLVFGSPKNRQRGDMSAIQAQEIAHSFFSALGSVAQKQGTVFCIEPNATQYACDFITTAQEGINLVKAVDNPGFRLHLDIACMTLAGDDITASIVAAAPYLSHFHISSQMLEDVVDRPDVHHSEAAAALKRISYDGFVSIEMRPARSGENLARVERAVSFAQATY